MRLSLALVGLAASTLFAVSTCRTYADEFDNAYSPVTLRAIAPLYPNAANLAKPIATEPCTLIKSGSVWPTRKMSVAS